MDTHPESAFGMRIQETKIMQIHADADPQHWAWVLAESDCELPESQEPD